ncbi:YihY/virulence factor BrkB family protein [Jannaschia sp. R86511]|uniref:YihY/virulence factor BrkB family protein n=1 Tax=Jannaschia sp. R86511 TaxID=3093853 RepID=UPI0036D21BB7
MTTPARGLGAAAGRLWLLLARPVWWLDRQQQRSRWTAVPAAVLVRYRDADAGNWASLLAYYAFLSLLPALLLLVTSLGYLLQGDARLQQLILDTAVSEVPVIGQQLATDVTSLRGSPGAVVIGLVVAAYGASGVLRTAHAALDTVAGVPGQDRASWLGQHGRAAVVGLLILVCLLLAAVTGAAAATVSIPLAGQLVSLLVALLLAVALLMAALRLLTSRTATVRATLPGAVVGGVGFTALHVLGGLYLDRVVREATLTYGTFATVIGLLAWLYLLARVFVTAAALNAVLADRSWPVPVVLRTG